MLLAKANLGLGNGNAIAQPDSAPRYEHTLCLKKVLHYWLHD